jgi:NTE family protein
MSNPELHAVRRALVLGGGAVLGFYWESGLLRALSDAGLDFRGFEAIVGTSAGAIAAVAIASGQLPESPDETRARRRSNGAAPDKNFPLDLSEVDANLVTRIYRLWASAQCSSVEHCAAMGALALQNDRRHVAAWLADFDSRLSPFDWGAGKLRVAAVDAVSGERRVFGAEDRVALPHAIAASCALPGLCPPVEIEGGFYMDGGVHSSTNADVLVAERPAQVLIVTPTNTVTTRIGAFAEHMLMQERAALQAVGCRVEIATATARDAARFGTDLMNYARIDDAYAAGLEAGREWAGRLRWEGDS